MSGADPHRWPVALASMFEVKRQIAQLEDPSLIGFTMPRVRVSEQRLAAGSRALPTSYRDWLAHADGWAGCYFELSLLPLDDVVDVPDVLAADAVLGGYAEFDSLPPDPATLVLVGTSAVSAHRVLVRIGDGADAGTTWWVDEDAVETYPSFYDFFLAVLQLHRIYLDQLSR